MDNDTIHSKLAKSYLTYFICSILGLFIDTFLGIDISLKYGEPIAFLCFVIGTFLILWAQATSRKKNISYFFKGPYRYMRNPTHLGIVFLVTGYTLVSGSIIFFGITIVGYFISNIFYQKYESILDRTYGPEYEKYKAEVPKIL